MNNEVSENKQVQTIMERLHGLSADALDDVYKVVQYYWLRENTCTGSAGCMGQPDDTEK